LPRQNSAAPASFAEGAGFVPLQGNCQVDWRYTSKAVGRVLGHWRAVVTGLLSMAAGHHASIDAGGTTIAL
jgi:hypothetical protein